MAAVERTDWREEPGGRKISDHYNSPGKAGWPWNQTKWSLMTSCSGLVYKDPISGIPSEL